MFKKILYGISVFGLAFGILSVSVLQSASVSYVFASPVPESIVMGAKAIDINYQLPYSGKIMPDSPLWFLKAARDKVWYLFATTSLRKAELALLFSDKRLVIAQDLFKNKKADIGFSTLSKGEKYLEVAMKEEEAARKAGFDTKDFLSKIATSSLKHRQIVEEEIIPLSPEDAKPNLVKVEDYSKNIYRDSRDALNSLGQSVPINPFDGQ